MTPEEFAEKVDYEGGVFSALEYGLRARDLDPGYANSELAQSWLLLTEWWRTGREFIDAVENALDDLEEN